VKLLWILAIGLSVGFNTQAGPKVGDEDPFPLVCLNFTGNWKSDSQEFLQIQQGECKWLKVRPNIDSQDGVTTILPDGKSRSIVSGQYTGFERHRWNSKERGTAIETYRTLYYTNQTVEELVLLEMVNADLLLETTYRSYDKKPPKKEKVSPKNEYSQRVFRRVRASGIRKR
jgi:hypothetical protein